MKKLIIMAVALFGMTALSSNAFAAESVNEVAAMSETTSAVTVTGTLTRVYMNGEKTAGQTVTGTVQDNGDGTINITLDEFKVGKMPGYISIVANNISVNGGSFNETFVEGAVKFASLRLLRSMLRYQAHTMVQI